jgi:long-subunit acyl-CoA synthetase (AMP-forming)
VDKFGAKRWISRGRRDDLVKLSWLAKFHATHIEDAISRPPSVKSVVVGGEGREVPYIIIEPRDQSMSGSDPEKFIDEIYNTVIYDVNERGNDEIRIPREMVMLADPGLPFKRTLKMTVMRLEVEKTYKDHIETQYLRWKVKNGNGHAAKSLKEGVS